MKILSLSLCCLLTFSSLSAYAQVAAPAPTPAGLGVASCYSRLSSLVNAKDGLAGSVAVIGGQAGLGAGFVGFMVTFWTASVPAGLLPGVAIALVGGGIGGGMALVQKHRKNILEIFSGAAAGGNDKTKKLWKIARRKNPQAFKGMSYGQFLAAIHTADISGAACEYEDVPERRNIVKVLIEQKELDDQALGEKKASPGVVRDDSGRGVQVEKRRPVLEPAQAPSAPNASEH